MEFFLNEVSLQGQYSSMEDFIKDLADTVRCVKLIKKDPNSVIYKMTDFYNQQVTVNQKLSDLKHTHVTDELMRFQLMLDQEINNEPYWDEDFQQNLENCKYYWEKIDVGGTAMAEAAIRGAHLISFKYEGLVDRIVYISEERKEHKETYEIQSVNSDRYLAKCLGDEIRLSRNDYLNALFHGTRINYSTVEKGFDAGILEKAEYDSLVSTFTKFVEHDSFETIDHDEGLEYKKYKPSRKDKNVFSAAKYRNIQIMKFRFSKKMRVFGYRKEERFCVLRIERDHKISDYG